MNTSRECPACSGKKHVAMEDHPGLFICQRCEALHGQTYLGASFDLVKPYMVSDEDEHHVLRLRYYDITCLGSEGLTRRHGWYDPETGFIHQVG